MEFENSNQAEPSKQLIFLIGFMGCGKSTLGKKVAKKTDYTFIDLDELIVKEIGMSISMYFETFGEDSFRAVEQKMLHSLKDTTNTIVATGGGAPCFFDNMDWMNQYGKTVYIKLSPKALVSRLLQKEIETRPLLKGKSQNELVDFISATLEERTPFYSRAKIVYDGLQSNPKDLIKQILL